MYKAVYKIAVSGLDGIMTWVPKVLENDLFTFVSLRKVRAGSGANLQGNGYIESVTDMIPCGYICKLVDGCKMVSLDKENKRCYLKSQDAIEVNYCISKHF